MHIPSNQIPVRRLRRLGRCWRGAFAAVCLLSAAIGLGCDRASSPRPTPAPATTRSAPAEAPPTAPVPDAMEHPDRQIQEARPGTFTPPSPGAEVTIYPAGGTPRSGILRALHEDEVHVDFGMVRLTYPRAALAMRSRVQLFEADYLQVQVLAAARREQQRQAPPSKAPASPRPGPPVNDPADGSVWQVRVHLVQTLTEPDSIQYLDWSPVMASEGGYRVVCTYRARAGSFGMVTERKVFHLDRQGGVTAVSPVRWDPAQDPVWDPD